MLFQTNYILWSGKSHSRIPGNTGMVILNFPLPLACKLFENRWCLVFHTLSVIGGLSQTIGYFVYAKTSSYITRMFTWNIYEGFVLIGQTSHFSADSLIDQWRSCNGFFWQYVTFLRTLGKLSNEPRRLPHHQPARAHNIQHTQQSSAEFHLVAI